MKRRLFILAIVILSTYSEPRNTKAQSITKVFEPVNTGVMADKTQALRESMEKLNSVIK